MRVFEAAPYKKLHIRTVGEAKTNPLWGEEKMKQTTKMFLLMVKALSVTAGADAHCLDHAAAGPIRLVIGVDRSLSTAPAQANVWLDMAMKLVKCLRPG